MSKAKVLSPDQAEFEKRIDGVAGTLRLMCTDFVLIAGNANHKLAYCRGAGQEQVQLVQMMLAGNTAFASTILKAQTLLINPSVVAPDGPQDAPASGRQVLGQDGAAGGSP